MKKEQLNGKNIVLIGMSGCGKSRIARILAKRYDLKHIDTDANIRKKHGNITDLFNIGEEYFRNLESEEIMAVAKEKDSVIATGGGCILREENMNALKENGIIVYVKRSIKNIIETSNIGGKPALASGMESAKLTFARRKKLYEKYADITVTNEGHISAAVSEIDRKISRLTRRGENEQTTE